MSFWSFIWIAIWREAGAVTRGIQIALVTLPALAAVVVSAFGGEWSKDLWSAQTWLLIAAGMVGASILVGIVRRAFSLENERVVKILISDPIMDHRPWNANVNSEKIVRQFFIKVTNLSTSNISKCTCEDIGFVNRHGHRAYVTGRFFRMRAERAADPDIHSYVQYFDLRGKGAFKEIDICSLDEREKQSMVIMHYATSSTNRQKDYIKKDLFPHDLTIQITADNLAIPEIKKFRIDVSSSGQLTMETVPNGAR